MKAAFFTGDALDYEARRFIDKNAQCIFLELQIEKRMAEYNN
jgi:hypothetical protein